MCITAGEAEGATCGAETAFVRKSRRDGTLLTVCFSLREISLRTFSLRAILLPALMFFFCAGLHAQVTIGGLENPKTGAILDLNSTAKGGLLLSNVTITDPEFIPYDTNVFPGIDASGSDVNPGMCGAMVYNTGQGTTVPAGIYIWNGCRWTTDGNASISLTATPSYSVPATVGSSVTLGITASGCPAFLYQWYEGADVNSGTAIPGETGATYSTPTTLTEGTHRYYCTVSSSANPSKATSEIFTVNIMVNPAPVYHTTKGHFTGKRCFDIAYSDADGNCGAFGPGSLRAEKKTVFSDRTVQDNMTLPAPPYTGVQVYTFRLEGTMASNVRFAYTDETMLVIDSIAPVSTTYSGQYVTEAKIAVYYKASLDKELKGRTNARALHAKLYVIFLDRYGTGQEEKLELDIMLQDCSCCDGAWITGGAWDYYLKTLRANEYQEIPDANNNLNLYFTPAAVGDLCWYKKDGTISSLYIAINNCMNGSNADGDPDGGWRIPNIKELNYLYRQLPGTGDVKTGEGSVPFFFGNSPDAAPLFNNGNNNNYSNNSFNSYWSINDFSNNIWSTDFGNGRQWLIGESLPVNVRCVRRL
jgi:hypothetical protein